MAGRPDKSGSSSDTSEEEGHIVGVPSSIDQLLEGKKSTTPKKTDNLEDAPDESAEPKPAPVTPSGGGDAANVHEVSLLVNEVGEDAKDQDKPGAANQAAGSGEGAAPAVAAGASASSPPEFDHQYMLKQINFDGSRVSIITQNENGPCPLIALMNVLLLRRKISLPPDLPLVTSDRLLDVLADTVLNNTPQISPEQRVHYEKNMNDAILMFDRLQTGLDVNVKFTGVKDFEYTMELIIFDLLNIPLVHGWLVEPQCEEARAVERLTYNQLVEKIISDKSSSDQEKLTDALLAEQFITRTASQLTYHGFSRLHEGMRHHELSVFFRNNHFNTLYKRDDKLLMLVTDSGYLSEPGAVWELLNDVEGDSTFLDDTFRPNSPQAAPAGAGGEQGGAAGVPGLVNTDADRQMALQLEREMREQAEVADVAHGRPMSDVDLAQKLQEEEELAYQKRQAEAARRQEEQRRPPPQHQVQQRPRQQHQRQHSEEKKEGGCVLL